MTLRPAAIRAMGRSHRAIYRLTGGRVLGRVAGMPVLLLTTTGRRSGHLRTTPLTYFEDGDTIVIVASNGGEDTPPAWWLNLSADPRASITIGAQPQPVQAREATSDEHSRLWPMITKTHAGYAGYARRTTRPIPIVILVGDGGSPSPTTPLPRD
ncbi:MAG: nitroreductase family deazaflavin-dependent oxidoreductase [Thermoleophilia bacterium]|nr:nitroreductase family deazaflavin-dependent oxidoreductase [Thermoleophilia bacterium]